ncbi:class II fructose-bisphosphate aldolase [Roseospira visakhapatnamensis]|uniref:Ketose-bisphosphate aldolase n=1 Tax=Roseospira visakhapatnamensis TaxID=390880 RepID=A0A7W6WA14_9PROT|nr:ketose-bisphosphate aldolase [Roseospira visakhapatnamensis]
MSQTPFADILQDARARRYAVPAFNAWTYQDALALVAAAERARSPLIVQTSGTCIRHNGLALSFQMVKKAVRSAKVPVAVHLDHGEDRRLICDAIHMGYDSVMYDGSKLPVDTNIENTRIIKAVAEAYGVSVEAEIGHVVKGAGDAEVLTAPDDALRFLAATRVDALAVAVGTRHGMQTQDAPLRLDALDALSAAVEVPLVLHGSSGVSDAELPTVARSAVCKVNIATRLRTVFIRALGEEAATYTGSDHIAFVMRAHEATIREATMIMELLGSANRC